MYDQEDIQNNKVIAMLSNIPILFWLPFVACPTSRFAKFHANQGLLLLIISSVCAIVFGILGLIPIVRIITNIIAALIGLVILGLVILGMVKAHSGEAFKFPIIGEFELISSR